MFVFSLTPLNGAGLAGFEFMNDSETRKLKDIVLGHRAYDFVF